MTVPSRALESCRWFATELTLATQVWSGPDRERAEHARARNVDLLLTALAAVLPWSTSLSTVLALLTFIAVSLTVRPWFLTGTLNHWASILPLALVLLAALSMNWALDVPWVERAHAAGKSAKLLLLPLLFYHFQFSRNAKWILVAFASSNLVLAVYSFLVLQIPSIAITARLDQPGIPVRNYIDQSQAFAFIAIALLGIAFDAASRNKFYTAAALVMVACAFLADLIFVNVARTAFVYLPAMLALLIHRYASRRGALISLIAFIFVCIGLWATSANVQRKVFAIFTETSAFETSAPIGERPPSAAMRLEFWRKSPKFFATAPIFGHGTGSIRSLFEQDAVGQTGLSALVTANPHNQTLAAAVQWGLIGVVLLWSMWISHIKLFRDPELASWIGLVAVVQNIVSSMFNSHLTDFYEGWIYVLAVGAAGGRMLHKQNSGPPN